MNEDTKATLIGFAVFAFIGGFAFPPLFAVGIFLLVLPTFKKGEFARRAQAFARATQSIRDNAKRIGNYERLRLISSHLLGPIQAKLKCAIAVRSIAEQLENDPKLKEIYDRIKLTSPTDSSTDYQPLDIDRELAELASLLPTNAELASMVLQSQKDCASELRRIRERLQADSALLQQYRNLRLSSVCENFDAFRAFGSLGGSATNQVHSLVREVDAFQYLLGTGPHVCASQDGATDKPTVNPRRGAPLPISEGLVSKAPKNQSGRLKSDPVELSRATNSHHKLADVSPRPGASTPSPLYGQQETLDLQGGSIDDPMLQEALDAYEDSRREEREASYELLRRELSAFQAEAAILAEDQALRSKKSAAPESNVLLQRQLAAHVPLSRRISEDRYKFVYYIAPIGNLLGIARHGLLSHARVATLGIEHHDISDPSVQRRRDGLDGIYRRPIHDYVPLYFNPRNPMLYKRRGRQHEVVILEISVAAASRGVHLFTDGNAAAAKTKFGKAIETVRAAEQALFVSSWTDYPDGKRQRCAEMLVLECVPVECFVRAIAIHAAAAAQARPVLPCPVTIDNSYFF